MAAPKVFVSYVHESRRHQDDVLAFATFLRSQGVDAVLDVWTTGSRHDWYAWALREMTDATYVVVVASPTYRAVGDGSGPDDRNRGARSEAALLRDLVYGDRGAWTPKVLPVLLPGHGVEEIPRFLSPYTTSRFEVAAYTVTGAEELLRVIHRSPGHVPPPVLSPPDLPPRPVPTAVVWCAGMPGEIDRRPDSVEVHLVPGEDIAPHSAEDMRTILAELAARTGGGRTRPGPEAARLDASGATAWVTAAGTGLAILRTGQRSAWFTLADNLDRSRLVAALAKRVAVLAEVDPEGPSSWVPAIGVGSVHSVLPPLTGREWRPAELAARLADDVFRQLPSKAGETARVNNVISGNVSGNVVQAGEIRGGIRF